MMSAKMNTGFLFFSCDLSERDGLGASLQNVCWFILMPAPMMQFSMHLSCQGVLDEHAADFPVLPVDVVRPFDADVFGIAGQCFADRQCHGLGQDELPVGFHFAGMEEQAEQKVLTGFRFPRITGLSSSGSLEVSRGRIMSFGETGR